MRRHSESDGYQCVHVGRFCVSDVLDTGHGPGNASSARLASSENKVSDLRWVLNPAGDGSRYRPLLPAPGLVSTPVHKHVFSVVPRSPSVTDQGSFPGASHSVVPTLCTSPATTTATRTIAAATGRLRPRMPRSNPRIIQPPQSCHIGRHFSSTTATTMAAITDPNTLSNHHSVVTRHTTIDVALDFKTSSVSGDAALMLTVLRDGVEEVVLDTSYLDVKRVAVGGRETTWKLDGRKEPYGSALRIALADKPNIGDSIDVTVRMPMGLILAYRAADGHRSRTKPPRNAPRFSG